MQSVSGAWTAALRGEFRVETKAVVGGVEYPVCVPDSAAPSPVTQCRLTRQLFTADRLIGNACAGMLELTFYPSAAPPTMAEISIFARLVGEDGATTEWLPQGTFYIDERKAGYFGSLSVVAYDRMLMAEEAYFSAGVISGVWPSPAPTVVSAICARLGISLDPRTALNGSVMVDCPVGLTMRDMLRYIAAAHGGNWTITAENKLRLVTLPAVVDRLLLTGESGAFVGDEAGNRVVIYDGVFLNAGYVCADYSRLADELTVGRVTLTANEETVCTAGSFGYEVTADCPFATQRTADSVLAVMAGRPFVPFTATGVRMDPAAELGDRTLVAGDFSVLGAMVLDLGAAYLADIGAPITSEVAHEYPYRSQVEKSIDRKVRQAKAEIRLTTESITAEVAAVDGRVTTVEQTADQITSTVTGLDGRVSTVEQTATGLTSTVSGLDGDVSTLYQKVNNITLEVSNRTSSSTISLNVDGIEMSSKIIRFTGDVVFASDLYDGVTEISGDCITTGEISARYIKLGGQMEVYRSLSGSVCGGYLGYMTGQTATGSSTSGIGIANDDESAVMICTSAGARMGYDGTSSVVCTSSKVTLTANQVVVDGTLKSADGAVITSDRSAKKHISYGRMGKYLRLFDLLRPAVYRLKGRKRRHLGFIAQDVEEALETAGIPTEDFAGLCIGKEGYGLRYEEFIPLLTAKVQQLEERIRRLEGRNG